LTNFYYFEDSKNFNFSLYPEESMPKFNDLNSIKKFLNDLGGEEIVANLQTADDLIFNKLEQQSALALSETQPLFV
jgi:hypothetical protein